MVIIVIKIMVSNSKIKIEKFNGKILELWKLTMEDILVDKENSVVEDHGTTPTNMSTKYCMKFDRKVKSTIWLCLWDSTLLNVLGEDIDKVLWDKLGILYQSKSLVNKCFLQKKLYLLWMNDGDFIIEHLNVINILVIQLLYINTKKIYEDKFIGLLFSLSNSWDRLIISIGSNATTLNFEYVVSSLLSKEMRWKNMDSQIMDALSIRGHSWDKNKNKSSWGRSNIEVDLNLQENP